MLKCYNLIIKKSENLNTPWFTIGDLQLSVNENGSLKTKDKDGNEKVIDSNNGNGDAYGKIKHLEVSIINTTQTIHNNSESQIYLDNDFSISGDTDFSMGENENSIKILSSGHYFISFNISLDMYNGNKTTVGGYVKTKKGNNEKNILDKSISYSYFHQAGRGFGSINNSFIYDADENDELSLYVKVKEGNGKFYTVPESTNFNIFKIQ